MASLWETQARAMRPGTQCHHPRCVPHPCGDSRTHRTGIPNSNAPGFLPRVAPLLSEPAWTRRADARILHGTGDTMADAGGRHDAPTGPRTTGLPPAPAAANTRWRVAWQSRRMPCAASRSRCAPNVGEPAPQQACCPLALEESDLCASNPSRPHGATRSAPIPAPSVATRPPMMQRIMGPVPVARPQPPPSRRVRSGSRRPGCGPMRRKPDARPDRPLVTPRSRVADPLRCSLSRSYANPHGFTRPINYTETLPHPAAILRDEGAGVYVDQPASVLRCLKLATSYVLVAVIRCQLSIYWDGAAKLKTDND